MSKQKSRYDELHDHYDNISSTKSGTRYERLVAFVFKYLDQSNTVIHDLKLVGDSEVSHQIDVIIERNGKQQRTLLECKDFDISGNKVGLSVIRDFHSVIADINPDEAYVVTCNGFTNDAERYAKSKHIGLVVLREFCESDWAGRIRQININVIAVVPSPPNVEIEFKQDDGWQKINKDLKTVGIDINSAFLPEQPVFFNTPDGRFQANDFIQRNRKYSVTTPPGAVNHDVDVSSITFEIDSFGSVELKRLNISYEISHDKEIIEIGGDRIARLLLQGIGSDNKVIWDNNLGLFKVDKVSREIL